MTLNQPSAKSIFNNNQAKLDCVITGQDLTIIGSTNITWTVDGQPVSADVTETTNFKDGQHIKNSTMTRDLPGWQKVKTVTCSASLEDRTPVIQDLTVNRGGTSLVETLNENKCGSISV